MSGIIEFKEIAKRIYAKYDAYLNPIFKFILSMIILCVINAKIGYMSKIDNIFVVLILALLCSFLPMPVTAVVTGLFILLHLYALSVECALVAGVLLFLMFLLYVRFVPKETIVVLLTPILFLLKMPYLMPVAMGLLGGPASVISVSFGVIVAYLIELVSANSTTFTSLDDGNMVSRIRLIVDGLLGNKSMFVMIIVFAVTLIIVYTIRRRAINYAWTIAIVSGTVVNVVILLMSDLVLDLGYSVPGILIGSIVGVAVCIVLQFFNFNLDYDRSENLQFEDDDYYYYVKAVPKVTLELANRKVKKVSTRRPESSSSRTSTGAPRSAGTVRTVHTANGTTRTMKK